MGVFLSPAITEIRRSGAAGIRVTFSTVHAGFMHQLYAGRTKISETTSATQRVLDGQLFLSRWPQWLSVVAVSGADVGVDHGSKLPDRPYNVVQLTFDQATWAGAAHEIDVKIFELFRGSAPAGAIDYTVPRDAGLADSAAPTYTLRTDPLPGTGSWNLGIRGRDTTEANGNSGTAAEIAESVIAIPPDFDSPFTVAVVAGTGTVTVTIPPPG